MRFYQRNREKLLHQLDAHCGRRRRYFFLVAVIAANLGVLQAIEVGGLTCNTGIKCTVTFFKIIHTYQDVM